MPNRQHILLAIGPDSESGRDFINGVANHARLFRPWRIRWEPEGVHALITKDWIAVQMGPDTVDADVREKLAAYPAQFGGELYNITSEIWQQTDLAKKHPERFQQLMQRMRRYYEEVQPSKFDGIQLDGPYPQDWGAAVVDDLEKPE